MIPSALQFIQEIAGRSGRVAVFLDYDGTLTPIVSHPENAWLADSMRQTLRELAARVPVAILSGRDLDNVRKRVEIDDMVYAGSHGFDIAAPRGLRGQMATDFSIAAHYRNVNENDVPEVQRAVDAAAARHPELRRIDGKKVYELLPNIDWNKGKAVLWLLQMLGLESRSGGIRPIYIGDDRTDEDAFHALEQRGVGILVSEQSQPTAARYSLQNPLEVERFLRALTAHLPAGKL
jgi:alpha,alpha-trehalase